MGGTHYIPRAHDTFFIWQSDFYTRVNEKLDSFNIDTAKLEELAKVKSSYELAFHQASNPDAANRADRLARNRCEEEYKTAIRHFVNENIRFNRYVSDSEKQYLGLKIADRTPTPVSIPVTHPVIEVDFSETRVHTLHLKDEALSGRAKPEGVRNAEVWVKTGGEQPLDDSEMSLAGTTSDGKLRLTYTQRQVGLRAYYQARWINTRSQAGAFGSIVSAIIA